MAKWKYSNVVTFKDCIWVFFSDHRVPDVTYHINRQRFDLSEDEEAKKFAQQWTKPTQGVVFINGETKRVEP